MFGNSDDIDTKNNYLKAAQEIIDNSDPIPEIGDRPDCAPQDSNHTTIDRSDMIGAIRGYCNGIDGDLKRTEDDHKGPYLSNNNKGSPKYSIGFDFNDAQGGCKSADTYDPPVDECLDKFTSIVDDCMFHGAFS